MKFFFQFAFTNVFALKAEFADHSQAAVTIEEDIISAGNVGNFMAMGIEEDCMANDLKKDCMANCIKKD